MKKLLFFVTLMALPLIINGQELVIKKWLAGESLPVAEPAFISGNDIDNNAYSIKNMLTESYTDLGSLKPSADKGWNETKADRDGFVKLKKNNRAGNQLSYIATYIESGGLNRIKVEVESQQMFEVFINGKKISSNYTSQEKGKTVKRSGTHDLDQGKFCLIIKTLYDASKEGDWKLSANIETVQGEDIVLSLDPTEKMTIHHLLEGTKLGSLSLSAEGKYALVNYSRVDTKTNKISHWSAVKEVESGKLVQSFRKGKTGGYRWMPQGNSLYYTEEVNDLSTIFVYDFDKREEYPVVKNIADMSGFMWAPDCSYIIYNVRETEKTDKSTSLKYMDELGNRTFRPASYNQLYKYDIKEGISQRLSYGKPGVMLNDISHDGRYILFSSSRPNPTQRPFTLQNMYLMDMHTGKTRALWEDNRWGAFASFSPDGNKLLVSGGPNTFGDTGRNTGKETMANNYDGQLYIYELSSGDVDPITYDFNPSVGYSKWHPADNRIYLTASDEVYARLYVWDEATRSFENIAVEPDVLSDFSIADQSLTAAYCGTSISKHNRAWLTDLASGKSRLFANPEKETYSHVGFGSDSDWNFRMPDGREIKGYMLYPVNFDPSKKYPLIVNYYGGTSPVEKSFGGRYPMEIWAANGYVVYVPQPSGATGFGQEFSARHQNTWGKDAADEVIEGTRQFMAAHDFVDPERVGCIGASYGGFMTMLIQTKTDLFTCAVSHAGISSISSYWGEGYWGYVYSSEATGDSYPWNRKDIYVDQSALFSADKITTPMLLLHGSVDTNVPLGESLQLWVALKILGRPVEMVQVEGEDHHILTYSKRVEWHNAIMSWFNKWLKGDDSDWKEMFPKSKL